MDRLDNVAATSERAKKLAEKKRIKEEKRQQARLNPQIAEDEGHRNRHGLGIKKPGDPGYKKTAESVKIGGQCFHGPTPMVKKFAALAMRQGWSRPITNEMMREKKYVKVQNYRSALPGWSVGFEMKGDARCSHCKAMGSDSKRPFKECVVIKGFWNGACVNCYHYCRGVD